MFGSYADTVAHYRALQRGAHRITEEAFARVLRAPLALDLYDARADDAWHTTWRPRRRPTGAGGWHWPRIVRTRWRRPSAFRLAIWSGPVLCGLAIGRPSRRTRAGVRRFVAVEMIEGAPFSHPLPNAIAGIATLFAIEYARLLGSSRVLLIAPDPALVKFYARRAFRQCTRKECPFTASEGSDMTKRGSSRASEPDTQPRAYNTETVEEAIARVRAMPSLVDELGAELFLTRAEEHDGRGILCGSAPEFELYPREKPKKKRRR